MANYIIKDRDIIITGNLTKDEVELVTGLASAGYAVKTAEPEVDENGKKKRKVTAKTVKKEIYYSNNLTAAEYQEFKKKKKELNYPQAAQWANQILLERSNEEVAGNEEAE